MATTYGARRADGHFDQEVAIKLIRRGMDTEGVLERFRAERQILAPLPFLVTERVDGSPIERCCDERGLSIDGRLALFQRVARRSRARTASAPCTGI